MEKYDEKKNKIITVIFHKDENNQESKYNKILGRECFLFYIGSLNFQNKDDIKKLFENREINFEKQTNTIEDNVIEYLGRVYINQEQKLVSSINFKMPKSCLTKSYSTSPIEAIINSSKNFSNENVPIIHKIENKNKISYKLIYNSI